MQFAKNVLTLEEQVSIFEQILREKISFKKKYINPFRLEENQDNNPGAFFWINDNFLYFVDFADYPTHRNWEDIIYDATPVKFKTINSTNKTEGTKKTSKAIILYKKALYWQKRDILYFNQYEITLSELESDFVFPVSFVQLYSFKHKKWYNYNCRYYCIYHNNNGVKMMNPKISSYNPKWISNAGKNDIGNNVILFNKEYYDKLIITKSYKDYRVLANIGLKVIWLQNEGMFPSPYLLKKINTVAENKYVLFDNDFAGIKASKMLKQKLMQVGGKNIHEIRMDKTKDASELVKISSTKTLKSEIWNKI
jgi:hypothetical protein